MAAYNNVNSIIYRLIVIMRRKEGKNYKYLQIILKQLRDIYLLSMV